MKLYMEISGEKHYIDEGIVEKYALYEGYVAPFTGLKNKKEDDTKVVAAEIKETETPLPEAIDDSETNTEITEIIEIDDSEDSMDVVVETTPEFATVSAEPLTDAKETNEALSKSEDMDVNEPATLVGE
jgi:glyceraldehyde-3-phosphate dehydrogenase/erythrose-4-phosphate dehydrogenase